MDVRAIVVVDRVGDEATDGLIAGTPMAFCDILGRPILLRILDRLQSQGVGSISVIGESFPIALKTLLPDCQGMRWIESANELLWERAEEVASSQLEDDPEFILLMRVGPYTEFDLHEVIESHRESRSQITSVVDFGGNSLNTFLISGSYKNETISLLQQRCVQLDILAHQCSVAGYCNALETVLDLRFLGIDSLMQRTGIEPIGRQVKPGVWVGEGASIHRTARVLGPAFIGAGARVRASAVITRCTSLEPHSEVDCGTVAENVTVLPFTYVGAGLDASYAIIGFRRMWSLRRNVEIEISDSKLIGTASQNAVVRTLSSLASLASFIPVQFIRGLFTSSQREQCSSATQSAEQDPTQRTHVPETAKAPIPTREFPADLVIARRYGND